MTDNTNLITQLREYAENMYVDFLNYAADALEEQAKRIKELEVTVQFVEEYTKEAGRLDTRIAELEAALKPFDEMLQRDFSIMAYDERYNDDFTTTVLMRLGDLRQARKVLGEK